MAVSYQLGEQEKRPWGSWEILAIGPNYVIKKIQVNPHALLSLQLHHHRSEHWVIVSGTAEITLDEHIFTATANTHIFIPLKTKHRIANHTDAPLIFIEIQTGDLLDESDIVRFNDTYGRV